MGLIDVSEILVDPDMVDPVVIIHRMAIIDDYGQNKLTEQGVPTYGSVQPISGKTLQRLPEELRIANVMSFWVKGTIVSDGKCQYPDVLNFRGSRYAVQTIFDWTMWGEGYAEGTCVREKPAL
jgi:hypothetical protein